MLGLVSIMQQSQSLILLTWVENMITSEPAHGLLLALSKIPQTWRQPRNSLNDEWINKVWFSHSMEFCSVMIKNLLIIAQKHNVEI